MASLSQSDTEINPGLSADMFAKEEMPSDDGDSGYSLDTESGQFEEDALEEAADESVNYDSEPVLEVEIDGTDYRIDVGKQGTALSVSHRPSGSWDWAFIGEAKWDNISLRCKDMERAIREKLAKALKESFADN